MAVSMNGTPNKELIDQLNILWRTHEGDYNAFDKAMRAAIAKAVNLPVQSVQSHVSYHRILSGEFTVAYDPRYGLAAIVYEPREHGQSCRCEECRAWGA